MADRTRHRAGPWLVLLLVCAGLGLGLPQWTAARTAAAYPVTPGDLAAGRAALDGLPVAGQTALTGYAREQFGPAWADVDGNGCDTRDDVLARDLVDVVRADDHCTVRSGTLHDPYTGETIRFTRGPGSSQVQIDHVVALADAWRTGAQRWTAAQRLSFANDRANLLAVQGDANQQKGSSDAGGWLPRPGYRCVYVLKQVQVKRAYGLWVTPAEKAAMRSALAGCRTA